MMVVLMIVLSMSFCAHAGESQKVLFKDWAFAYACTLMTSKIPPCVQCFLFDAFRKKMPGALCSIPTGKRKDEYVVGGPGDLGAASGYIKAGMDRAAEKMFKEKITGNLGVHTVKGFGKIKFQCKRVDNALKLTAQVMEEEQKESAQQEWSALFIFKKNGKSKMPQLNVWYEK